MATRLDATQKNRNELVKVMNLRVKDRLKTVVLPNIVKSDYKTKFLLKTFSQIYIIAKNNFYDDEKEDEK